MKMIAVNEKLGRSMEFGVEALIRAEYIKAENAGVKTLIDQLPGTELPENAEVLAIYTRGNDGAEVPHI
ncbi:MAG: hypothetical protein IJ751_04735, partial [Oscillospiraceae bacterium]|nr:hypothetical protein [Oscillospiraceae bacterium]